MGVIIAVDPSTLWTGLCIGDADTARPRVLMTELFTQPDSVHWAERIDALAERLDAMFATLARRDDDLLIAYEIPIGNRSGVTNRRLGAAEFAVVNAGQRHGRRVWGFNPRTVHKSGFGKRNITATSRLAGRTLSPDEADAVAVYVLTHRVLHGEDVVYRDETNSMRRMKTKGAER